MYNLTVIIKPFILRMARIKAAKSKSTGEKPIAFQLCNGETLLWRPRVDPGIFQPHCRSAFKATKWIGSMCGLSHRHVHILVPRVGPAQKGCELGSREVKGSERLMDLQYVVLFSTGYE